MNPKKSRDLIPEVAKETGVSQNIVEAIIREYWKEVWKNLTTLSSSKVHIENLGDFNIKHWLLDRELSKCHGFDNGIMTAKKRHLSKETIQERIVLLNNIKKEVEEENQRKEFIYEHKKISKNSKEDMEKQIGNLSGNIL